MKCYIRMRENRFKSPFIYVVILLQIEKQQNKGLALILTNSIEG